MLNKDLGTLLKEGKNDKICMAFDTDHPEFYAIPKILWSFCVKGGEWLPPVKKK